MFNKIINPKSGRKVSIYNKLGKEILQNYLNELKGGGKKERCPGCTDCGGRGKKGQKAACQPPCGRWFENISGRDGIGDCRGEQISSAKVKQGRGKPGKCNCWCCTLDIPPVSIPKSELTTAVSKPKSKIPKLKIKLPSPKPKLKTSPNLKLVKPESFEMQNIYQTGWLNDESCTYKINIHKKKNICSFDFDNTLVELHSSNPMPNVINTLKDLAKTCNILVFSNQRGIEKNHTTHTEVQKNMDDFSKKANVPISFFYSTIDASFISTL